MEELFDLPTTVEPQDIESLYEELDDEGQLVLLDRVFAVRV